MKYKNYWRKTGLKKPYGDLFLNLLSDLNPKKVLEIGVFCGVTARNICNFLFKVHGNDFFYYGIDLFGSKKESNQNEIEPLFLKDQHFSNPLKNIYYNYLLRENLNSIESVSKLLEKYKKNTKLLKGDSKNVLNKIPMHEIDFVFLDGGHSYDTVTNDLTIIFNSIKKGSTVLCDDYDSNFEIKEVSDAINDFSLKKNIKIKTKFNRFALLNS